MCITRFGWGFDGVHTCSLTFLPFTSIVLILKSIPMVVIKVGLKVSFAYRSSRHVLPTPAGREGGSEQRRRMRPAGEGGPRRGDPHTHRCCR